MPREHLRLLRRRAKSRSSELVRIQVKDVGLGAGRILIERGKGDKDCCILFLVSVRLLLNGYLAADPDDDYQFESGHRGPYSERRVQPIVREHAAKAGIAERVHPHLSVKGLEV